MTDEQLAILMAELERRWRSRTPAKDVNDLMPEWRVRHSEMRLFAKQQGFELQSLLDERYNAAVRALMEKLRREFPKEPWS